MIWVQYEVWGVDEDGHEELIETTNSLKEARKIAEAALTEQIVECIIYKEEDGELYEEEVVVREE
jgi:hypothetical protein